MSASDVIDEFKKLPAEEQRKVFVYLQALEAGANGSGGQPAGVVSEEFKQIAGEVFSKNEELFRKLAQ